MATCSIHLRLERMTRKKQASTRHHFLLKLVQQKSRKGKARRCFCLATVKGDTCSTMTTTTTKKNSNDNELLTAAAPWRQHLPHVSVSHQKRLASLSVCLSVIESSLGCRSLAHSKVSLLAKIKSHTLLRMLLASLSKTKVEIGWCWHHYNQRIKKSLSKFQ